MRRLSLSRIEKICFAAIIILAVLIAAVMVWWHMPQKQAENMSETASSSVLASPEDKLPQNLYIGHAPSVTEFTDADGKSVSLSSYRGSTVLLIFWGSWCPYCKKQMEIADDIAETAKNNGAKVLLVDKLDTQKETRSAAVTELYNIGCNFTNWFDSGLKAYSAWGIKQIPASVILDSKGNVAAYSSGLLTAGEYKGLFEYAVKGGGAATASFIKRNMTNSAGGVYCNTKISDTTPGGHDVLSETQGLMMKYAILSKDKSLFTSAWNYTRRKMEKGGLAAWYVTEKGKTAGVNAALDDLRIWSALSSADSLWGGYKQQADTVKNAIYKNCVKDGRLVNFYEFNSGNKSDSIALCYADITALRSIAKEDGRFSAVADNALATVKAGYISDTFPLYYSSYDYGKEAYSTDDLNTSEALYTLWHMSQAGELKKTSLEWLKKNVCGEGLAARYHVDGSVVSGFDYHSTAVYALATLIARQEKDKSLYNAALQKMERYRSKDADSKVYGSFGDSNTNDYPAFDQCMPLIVYEEGCP